MASDFRRQKLLHLFYAFDISKSGTIDKKDFEYSIARISQRRGLKPGDAKYVELQDTLWKVWDVIRSRADSDEDGEVSLDEWLHMWEQFAQDPAGAAGWQRQYSRLAFQLQDANGDGEVELEEYTPVAVSFGIDQDNAVKAFQRIAKGKQTVTWPAFQELWQEYLTTEDPEAPGNFIFGLYKTDS